MGKTLTEKIFSRAAGRDVSAGETVVARVDRIMSHEGFRFVGRILREAEIPQIWDPSRVVVVLDHAVPAPDEATAREHAFIRECVEQFGIQSFFDVRGGISHQVMVEHGFVLPSELVLGTDSHSTMYGALGAAGTGIGFTEAAYACTTGQLWFTVPHSIAFELVGELPAGVVAKDLVLWALGRIGADGGTYRALAWRGPGASSLSVESRMTVANMAVEMGAKLGLFEADAATDAYLAAAGVKAGAYQALHADADAVYESKHRVDLTTMEPMVARPHSPDNVCPVSEVKGQRIDQALLGSCTNARIEDLRAAAAVLEGRTVKKGVRMYVSPASTRVYRQALTEGLLEVFLDAGAVVLNPGCGACFGKHMGILAAGEVCISSTNRNFRGRMGSAEAQVFLASPETVAASAIAGEIIPLGGL